MNLWKQAYENQHFRFLDHSNLTTIENKPYNALLSFAIDDCLALAVGEQPTQRVMRMWTHDKTIVLGIGDSRLPHIKEGITFLHQQGYDVLVRNSGGLAVVLDENVLNISLILPNMRTLSIGEGYEAMKSFIKEIFKPFTNEIEAYEIVGSYCPGDYDLSIRGQKFAGISQRRVRGGVAVQIYLDVRGNSRERAEVIRRFYEIAARNSTLKSPPPTIIPDKMASLSTLLQNEFTVEDVKNRSLTLLKNLANDVVICPSLSEKEHGFFEKRYDQMLKRNEDIIK